MSDSDSDDHAEGEGATVNPKEWIRTVSTHLSFIGGFNAFPGKRPGSLNPSLIFNTVQRCDADRARQLLMVEGDVNATNTSGSSLTHVFFMKHQLQVTPNCSLGIRHRCLMILLSFAVKEK